MRHVPTILNATMQRVGALGGVKACTLTKYTPGTRTPGNISGGTNSTTTPYPASGWVEDYDQDDINGTLIAEGDRRIVILAASLPSGVVPAPNDTIAIADASGATLTYTIVPHGVRAGATAGTLDCQARA